MIKLPSQIDLSLPDWDNSDFESYRVATNSLSVLATGAGFGDRKTQAKIVQLREAAPAGADAIAALLNSSADIRAYANFLASSKLPDLSLIHI